MKTRKLLQRLKDFLDADRSAQLEELASILKVLGELELKEQRLTEKLRAASDPAGREELATKLEVVHAQRAKGLARADQLRAGESDESLPESLGDASLPEGSGDASLPEGSPDEQLPEASPDEPLAEGSRLAEGSADESPPDSSRDDERA